MQVLSFTSKEKTVSVNIDGKKYAVLIDNQVKFKNLDIEKALLLFSQLISEEKEVTH